MITETPKPESGANLFVPLGHAAPHPEHSGADEESAAIMADMAGGGDLPVEAGTKRKSRLSSQLLLMVGVLAISAAALYLMRRAGTGAGMTFVVPTLDYALEQEPSDQLEDHQRIIRELEALGIMVQVPTDDVEKNPFRLVLPDEETVDFTGLDEEAKTRALEDLRRKELERVKREISTTVAAVRIHSIMNGRIPVANIYDGDGDRLVRVGDEIGEYLKVVSINDRQVVLQAGGDRYPIEMGSEDTPTRRPRRR